MISVIKTLDEFLNNQLSSCVPFYKTACDNTEDWSSRTSFSFSEYVFSFKFCVISAPDTQLPDKKLFETLCCSL